MPKYPLFFYDCRFVGFGWNLNLVIATKKNSLYYISSLIWKQEMPIWGQAQVERLSLSFQKTKEFDFESTTRLFN
jgi:hypothetical protein